MKHVNLSGIRTSRTEVIDLIKAWAAISFAFGIVLGGNPFTLKFFPFFTLSLLTVGIAFILHELGHKFTAQHYGCFAEFRAFNTMLLLAIIMSFFGFIFAAPGAVMISGPVGKRRNGIISAAGPAVNLVLAFLSLSIIFIFPRTIIRALFSYNLHINSLIALFNLIPFSILDGRKILEWNKLVYGIMAAIALGAVFISNSIGGLG